jgi:hypothetical protein
MTIEHEAQPSGYVFFNRRSLKPELHALFS